MDVQMQVRATVRAIRAKARLRPAIAIVLGSGLGYFADSFEDRVAIPVDTLPHYPRPTITGHSGKIIIGTLHGVPLLAFQGRIHFYESADLNSVLYPIRVAAALGVKALIATNAAGGINRRFLPGDLMLLEDHLNLTFCRLPHVRTTSTLRNSPVYDEDLRAMILRCARRHRLPLRRGVYCGLRGPSYETAAEIRMLETLGCDAVGMSTVNETTFAHTLGIRVAAISCITNLSTGISADKLSHAEVTEVAERVKHTFSDLLSSVIMEYGRKLA